MIIHDFILEFISKGILITVYLYIIHDDKRHTIAFLIAFLLAEAMAFIHPYGSIGLLVILMVIIALLQENKWYGLLSGFIFLCSNQMVLMHDFHEELVFYASIRLLGVDFLMLMDEISRDRGRSLECLYHMMLFFVAMASTLYLMSYPLNHTYRLLIFVPVSVITLFYVVNSIFIERIIKVNDDLHMTKIQNHLQQEEYRILKQKYEEVRLLKHDMKNHLQVIAHLPVHKQESYINDYIKSMDYSLAFVIPDQPVLEAIINEKYEEAKKQNMKFSFSSHADLSFVKDMDIVTIFGNLLNNALEANDHSGFIDINIYEKKYFILIEVRNSIQIMHKEGHLGIGLSSIRKIADRYQGTASFTKEGDTYISKIILHKTHFRR